MGRRGVRIDRPRRKCSGIISNHGSDRLSVWWPDPGVGWPQKNISIEYSRERWVQVGEGTQVEVMEGVLRFKRGVGRVRNHGCLQ